jgi:NADPH:quinone reductase-like Zn-dependent oxidoreductase
MTEETIPMKAIVVTDQAAGTAGMKLVERPEPQAAIIQKALDFGAQEFVDLDDAALEDVGGVDLVFDVIGGDIQKRSAGLIRAGGTLVSIVLKGTPRRRRTTSCSTPARWRRSIAS